MATVAGLFNTDQEAERAIQALRNSGIEASNIGVVAQDRQRMQTLGENTGAETGAAAVSGAVGGAVLGGGLGLLLGAIGAVAVPVIGPIIAAGPLVAALTGAGVGAATGGLVGALTEAGIPQEEATVYQSGVERGGILVTAHVPAGQESSARAVMQQFGSLETDNARTMFANDPNYRLGQETTGNRGGTGEALGGGTGAVAGGVIGAVVGGPIGAVAGAAIGGAAGAGAGHVAQRDEGSNAGPMSGGASGALVGGAIGSVGGPIGTVAGAAIGSAVGGLTGEKATETGAEAAGTTQVPAGIDNPSQTTSSTAQYWSAGKVTPAEGVAGATSQLHQSVDRAVGSATQGVENTVRGTENVISTENSRVARSAENANIGAENAVEQTGVYMQNDAEDITRRTSGNIISEGASTELSADETMDQGIEAADTMAKRQNIGL